MIPDDVIECWKANYGLDKRTPEDAMRWWHDSCNGMAPAGAVAALGLCLIEIERLRTAMREANAAIGNWPEGAEAMIDDALTK
jgi:hypothetical protein